MFAIASPCRTSDTLKVIYFLKELFNISLFIIPIILIVMLTVDFTKNVASNNEDEMKKNTHLAIKRLLFAVVIFLVPSIVKLTFTILRDNDIAVNYTECFTNADIDSIIRFEEEEAVLKEFAEKREKELLKKIKTPKDKESSRKIVSANDSNNNSNDNNDANDTPSAKNASPEAFVQSLQQMSNVVQKDYKNGHKWKYTNAGGTSGAFSTAVKKKNRKTNCAKYISWGLVEIGILKSGQTFYKPYANKVKYDSDDTKKRMEKNLEYIDGKGYKVKTLVKNGKLKAGDIVLWYGKQHTNAYAGNEKWFDGGRWAATKGATGFQTFGPVKIPALNSSWRVWKILRVKNA